MLLADYGNHSCCPKKNLPALSTQAFHQGFIGHYKEWVEA